MATEPFSDEFEARLKLTAQGGVLQAMSGRVVNPRFFCCKSGTSVGVDKDPVALAKLTTGRRACTCSTVTIDYSDSWSPSSTINAVSVSWGDGNVSNPGWPGAGTVSHPGACGGYALPGTYTIELEVTDLLGATGVDTVEIEVVDCTSWATIEMYCSLYQTDSDGVWYSNNGGVSWTSRSGDALTGVRVYDLKINPFTVPLMPYYTDDNSMEVELWAASEEGLFETHSGGLTWYRNPSFPEELEVTAVLPSVADKDTIYVLANNALNDRVWLYMSEDGGLEWESMEISLPGPNFYQAQTYGWTHTIDMSCDGQYVYVALLDDTLAVRIIRAEADLSAYTCIADYGLIPTHGSVWGGVRCDYNLPEVLWVFGDLGFNGYCIDYSEDFGDNFEDRTPGAWTDHDDQVRPVLPSVYDPDFVIAINNEPLTLELAVTGDRGNNWEVSSVSTEFINHCGERGWYDDYLLFTGAETVPVTSEHLSFSPNLGIGEWVERSGGLPADAEVTSIQILYEHYT